MQEIILEAKLVGMIKGDFFIPSYQRGYRWGSEEVSRLLEDIYSNGDNNYCLQPIVVRKSGERYELIDGQQRLTTLYLIYRYMHNASGGFLDEPHFSLTYETREKSAEFLQEIDFSQRENNIDFWFICNAYETIANWFAAKDKKSTLTNMNKFFDERVKVIWYEVDENEDAIALFARLNIGKIPLTSAELVKAMFLSENNNPQMSRERQEEISLQWDTMERELHQEKLWYFLTNSASVEHATRIDLLLDLFVNKPIGTRDKYYTFFKIDELRKSTELQHVWKQIQHTFLIMKDWYEDYELYHKIGYLITSNTKTLTDIYQLSIGKRKTEFRESLDACIKDGIKITKNYGALSYDNSGDYAKISRLLLLFNVESIRQIGDESQQFPFDRYKQKGSWSLEHIHAQQSEGMRKQEEWKEWIQLHLPSVLAVGENTALVAEMKNLLSREKIEGKDFMAIQEKVVAVLSAEGSVEYLHSIANLALLNTSDNAALNNSTFDVKRNIIIDMDKNGKYIPFCTKMVFLKYYTPSESNQLHFWGQPDRDAYIKQINDVLNEYLTEPIVIEKVEEQ